MSRRKPLPSEPVELLIESLSHDGRGVGRHDGKTVFVGGALPQETVIVRLTQRRRKFDIARLEEVVVASPDRVEASCPHFELCGGCSLQNMHTAAQLRYKQEMLAENLKRIGKVTASEWMEPLQADIWAYRSKARLGVRFVKKKNRVLVGFREKGSSFITDTSRCEILISEIGRNLETIADVLGEISIRDAIPQIELAAGDSQICLIFRVLKELSDDDKSKLIQLASTLNCEVLIQPAGPDSIYPLTDRPLELRYQLPQWNLNYQFEPQDFTQVNISLNRQMVAQALSNLQLRPDDRVLDLFCGLGNFSLPVARQAGKVVGVEGEAKMVERAGMNASKNNIENVEFYAADLFLPPDEESWAAQDFDKVLLDPPRSGAETISNWLVQKQPEIIVYVSCNPSTLARDAGILVNGGGYKMENAGIMDMFPHTAHTEAMAVFRKGRV